MCRNWKLWAAIGVLALGVAVAASDARSTLLPLMFVAVCPVSMLLMAVGMARGARRADTSTTTEPVPAPTLESRETVTR